MSNTLKIPRVLGPTITTGTSEIDLGGSGVRLKAPISGTVLAVIVQAARAGVATAAESDKIIVRLKSNTSSMPIGPFEILAQPINAGVGADIAAYKEESPVIPVNCPCQVNDEMQITAAEGTACTVHVYVAVTVIYTAMLTGPQFHSLVGTQTSTGTAATEVSMTNNPTAISIQGGHAIRAIYATISDTTLASGKGIIGKFRISSSQFQSQGDLEFAAEPIPGVLGGAATGSFSRLTRLTDLYVPIGSNCSVAVYFNMAATITTAGTFNVQIMYT